jgi:phosphoribosylanthranilate isomerase
MTQIKICGITNWPDARAAVDCGANFLGFNFVGSSPRFVPVADAKRIIKKLPRGVATVGVFADEEPERIDDLGRILRLDFVQLHGRESPRVVEELSELYGVIKAFRIRAGFRPATLARYADAAALLLDAYHSRRIGGTGRSFDWRLARQGRKYGFIFLAGGLTPENVAQAIRAAGPFAVDVASGVESAPGKKDRSKLRAFCDAVRSAAGAAGRAGSGAGRDE